MGALQVYEVEEIDGKQYVSTEAAGVEYTLMKLGDGWFVSTHRKSLGHRHIGGGKHFATLEEVGAKCRAFRDFYAMGVA